MSVFLNVRNLVGSEVAAVIKDEILYLSVPDFFDFLKITNHISSGVDSISGFFLNPQDLYLIDRLKHNIVYQRKTFDLKPGDIIVSGDRLFLKSMYFGKVFDLECTFNIRSLTVFVAPGTELPIIRALRLEQLKLHFNRSEESFIADTTIGRRFRLLHIGSADWNINATQQHNGLSYARFGLALGGTIAGGELNGKITHTTNHPFLEKQQFYLWRYANNKNNAIRQVLAGKISTQPISSIYDPVVGIQITNAPTFFRRSFGSYTYNGYTQPDCMVELYVNNTLIDYIKADASGFLTYNIPLTYGNTEVKLRFFGPLGEEYTTEKNFVIPLSFLPENEFEYTASAGIIEDHLGSFYTQGRMNFGLTDRITVGGGLEYLSSREQIQSLPFLNASVRVGPGMVLTGEYVSGVRYKGKLSYFSTSGLQFELNYVKYSEPQEAVKYNYTEERKAVISMPLRFRKSSIVSRLAINQNILGDRKYYNMELQLSLAARGLNVNIISSYSLKNETEPNIYSTVTSSFRLPGGIRFVPRIIYDHSDKKFVSANMGVEKNFSGQFSVNASYEQRFDHPVRYYRLGVKYNFSFARISATTSISKNTTVFTQSASGSVIFETKLNTVSFTTNSNVGNGGIIFSAFLDINGNGKKDNGERNVKGITVKMHQGGGRKTHTDSTIMISALEPHLNYTFTVDGNSFENISWRITNTAIRIAIESNQLKLIEIPVVPVGEVSGMISMKDANGSSSIGRIRVNIYDLGQRLVSSTISESDGYFSYLGLFPGSYTARVDETQLTQLQMSVNEISIPFIVQEDRDGDIIDHLKFVLEEIDIR